MPGSGPCVTWPVHRTAPGGACCHLVNMSLHDGSDAVGHVGTGGQESGALRQRCPNLMWKIGLGCVFL